VIEAFHELGQSIDHRAIAILALLLAACVCVCGQWISIARKIIRRRAIANKTPRNSTDWPYCPRCRANMISGIVDGQKRKRCSKCNFVQYKNPKLVVAMLIPTTDDGLVLVRRKNNPGKGKWSLVAGIVDTMEHPETSGKRETYEEATVRVEIDRFLKFEGPNARNELICFYLTKPTDQLPIADDDADRAGIFHRHNIPADLAFDTDRAIIDWWFNQVSPAL
jgi:ADP-ribose pyrophosphatase YjhB (NUDIX family)